MLEVEQSTTWRGEMKTYPQFTVRLWRARPWSPNRLMRASDRFETLLIAIALVIALVAIPICAAAGTATYVGGAEVVASDAVSKKAITARVTTDPVRDTDRPPTWTATAEWTFDSRVQTTPIITRTEIKRGDEIPLWVDGSGKRVQPPRTSSGVVVSAVAVALLAWCAVASGVFLVLFGIRRFLDRERLAGWEREWGSVAATKKWSHP